MNLAPARSILNILQEKKWKRGILTRLPRLDRRERHRAVRRDPYRHRATSSTRPRARRSRPGGYSYVAKGHAALRVLSGRDRHSTRHRVARHHLSESSRRPAQARPSEGRDTTGGDAMREPRCRGDAAVNPSSRAKRFGRKAQHGPWCRHQQRPRTTHTGTN